ncbi:PspC domain-containing protein [Pseudanabaena sp. FACHB-2040]|uniref:PspC domain-containing protein n=1 Tax=Pseudanabaena sp. FACHB-2040 TaxID=2692859 RepID=UPI0016888AC8|nr:PspC domain-containing protein [Pseudanabaena sp. FACHB-2040]MBD2260194.1 PspC domain-containing protein [Pseudanabaena sp. FACHB-2040]
MATIFYSSLIGALFFFGPALAAIAIRRSLAIPWQLLLLGICIIYGVFPLLLAWGGLSLAESYGCEADITIYECPGNAALGDWVTGMTFAHWGAIITLPSGLLGAIGLIISIVLKANRSQTGAPISANSAAAFYRSRRHKLIAGVCTAVAQRSSLSVLGVRIGTVALTLVAPGFGGLLYLWMWLAFPLEPTGSSFEPPTYEG